MNRTREERWWKENFPSRDARDAADAACDQLDVNEPMSKFIDTWIAAYKAAGGKRPAARRD